MDDGTLCWFISFHVVAASGLCLGRCRICNVNVADAIFRPNTCL
jgi:hypothetical protein